MEPDVAPPVGKQARGVEHVDGRGRDRHSLTNAAASYLRASPHSKLRRRRMARVTVEDCVDKIPNRFDWFLLRPSALARFRRSRSHDRARPRQEPGGRAARDRREMVVRASWRKRRVHLQKVRSTKRQPTIGSLTNRPGAAPDRGPHRRVDPLGQRYEDGRLPGDSRALTKPTKL